MKSAAGFSEVRTIPSRIFSGSSIIASAKSTYQAMAVGVAQSRCVLISGIRCDGHFDAVGCGLRLRAATGYATYLATSIIDVSLAEH